MQDFYLLLRKYAAFTLEMVALNLKDKEALKGFERNQKFHLGEKLLSLLVCCQ
jgi:hypothetical protein